MFIHYTIQTQQNRNTRRPPQAPAPQPAVAESGSSSTPAPPPAVPESGSSSAPALPPHRRSGREYGKNDSVLPTWFSEEAKNSPPRRFNPDTKSELTKEVDFLRENHFLPDKSYGELLTQSAMLAQLTESARYAQELERYHELSGLRQFFTLKPYKNRMLTMLTFDFSQLEAAYPNKRDQGMVFCAMTELHDLGLVRMRGKYPYNVSITPLGKEVLERLEKKPPIYKQRSKPPEYELNTQA